jgi:hypothetical protein
MAGRHQPLIVYGRPHPGRMAGAMEKNPSSDAAKWGSQVLRLGSVKFGRAEM